MARSLRSRLSMTALYAAGVLAALPALATPGDVARWRGGELVALRGLRAGAERTDLALVNLAATENRCLVAVTGDGGEGLVTPILLTLAAGESRPFHHLFEHARYPAEGLAATATVACDRAFSTFAIVTDAALGRFDVVAPATAELAEVTRLAGVAAPAVACSAGALCFDAPGLVHVPAEGEELTGRVSFPAPLGVATRLSVSLDVKVGEWFEPAPSAKHLVYWFVVDKNIDMPGMLYFRGPGKNEAFARHGMLLRHAGKLKVVKRFTAIPGRTYRVFNDYDMAARLLLIRVVDLTTNQVVVTLRALPNVPAYTFKPGQKLFVDMGFELTDNPTEVPSYGWEYSNVHVEVKLAN